MAETPKDKELLETIVTSIVNKPDEVSVERAVDEMGVLLTLKVAPDDMGNIIGRKGQTAQAIRTLLKILGAKNNARVNLKIHDPNQEEGEQSSSQGSDSDSQSGDVDELSI
mgnify:CR=1 FL=1